MKVLEEGKYIINDDEEENFIKSKSRFDELCKKIKLKKQTLNILTNQSNNIAKEIQKTRNQLNELEKEQNEIEKYLITKHKKTFIVTNKINKLIDKLSDMTDREKINYLLNNKSAYELFTSIDFERFIQPKERGTEYESTEEID